MLCTLRKMCVTMYLALLRTLKKKQRLFKCSLGSQRNKDKTELHPTEVDEETMLPLAYYDFTLSEKKSIFQWLSIITV